MGRKKHNTPINVFLGSRLVGQWNRAASGAVAFKYHTDWLNWEHASPVSLSMPLGDASFTGETVLAVFDNLLPDNDPIRNRVAQRVGAAGADAFSLLSIIGRDCVGALRFVPSDEEPQVSDTLTGNELSDDEIETRLKQLDLAPLGLRQDDDFRISVAGAQEKTALLYHNGEWIEPTGSTPTTHIIKPQIGKFGNGLDFTDSVENEYFCLNLLRRYGLKTANVEMKAFNSINTLVVERFDRRWTDKGRLIRLPQEDCCQALSCPSTRKYQNVGGPGVKDISKLLVGSDEPESDSLDFFKAIVLFWLMGATDGHAKNFSLALFPQGRFKLTPIYDVLTLQPAFDQKKLPHKDYKLAMSAGNSNHYNVEKIHGRHFLETGIAGGLTERLMMRAFDDIQRDTDAAIAHTINALPSGFPMELVDAVCSGIQRRLPRINQ